jgi:lysophospholipase L1-like esterase
VSRFPLRSGQRVVFAGDSITDADRLVFPPLGQGFVRRFVDLVRYHHPRLDPQWFNRGVGGDITRDLLARWERDVLALEPDWLMLMVGINDCVGMAAYPRQEMLDRYRGELDQLCGAARAAGARLVLLDPFYVATPAGDWAATAEQLAILRRVVGYQAVVAELAAKHAALHVRTQRLFARQLAQRSPTDLAPEPVHPNPSGHLLIALELYRCVAGPSSGR